ncbi:hypothetical protein BGX38DRAFT_1074797, partial [Terfezia claveryi]
PNLEPHTLVRGDTLHTLYLGMLKHLMKWIQEFLDHIGRLTVFDHIWSRLPPFPGFTRPNKAYRSVSQWQGKEMRNLLRVLLAVFAAALTSCHKAILCVRYITDFILIAQYKVHTPGTIQSMKDYLEDFHKYKELFLRFRASNGAHYNFPKMHLILHFADQIAEYGSLPQFSTDICEALHKPLKDGYRRSNHVNAVPQVI